MITQGPESAGAHPGPVCYRKGGPLAITDANLLLGRLQPQHFPHIFGPTEDQPLDLAATHAALAPLADEINRFGATIGQAAVSRPRGEGGGGGECMRAIARASADCGKHGHDAATHLGGQMSVDEVAYGYIKVANEAMCRPIRVLTQARGFDTKSHVLSCVGGAGAQHACAIARALGIRRIFIHRHCSVLSAYGIALADVVRDRQVPIPA